MPTPLPEGTHDAHSLFTHFGKDLSAVEARLIALEKAIFHPAPKPAAAPEPAKPAPAEEKPAAKK